MRIIVSLVLGFFILLLLSGFIWRLASRRFALPCPVWLSWFVENDNPLTRTNQAAAITEHLELRSGMSVLDVGCGPGRLAIPVARKVGTHGRVVAVDVQPGMLQRARGRAQEAGVTNIRFILAEAGDGNVGRELYDRALLVTVLGEILDQEAALKEIFDALKPGGILSVTESIFDPHFQSRATVTRLALAVGFREKQLFGNRIAFTLNLEKPYSG